MTEGSLCPVACLEHGHDGCDRAELRTVRVWRELDSLIENYLNGVTLADLVRDESFEEPSGPCIS
ncbi:MAG: hypothetical protein ACLTKG_02035 [Collinsella intestinalis]